MVPAGTNTLGAAEPGSGDRRADAVGGITNLTTTGAYVVPRGTTDDGRPRRGKTRNSRLRYRGFSHRRPIRVGRWPGRCGAQSAEDPGTQASDACTSTSPITRIAAWFAVGQNDETDKKDARLIAFATQPVSKPDNASPSASRVELDAAGGDRMPPWHSWATPATRQGVDWGTGARRRLWVPPAYDPRIAAQNAAFIVDGVPIPSARTASYFGLARATIGHVLTCWQRLRSTRRRPSRRGSPGTTRRTSRPRSRSESHRRSKVRSGSSLSRDSATRARTSTRISPNSPDTSALCHLLTCRSWRGTRRQGYVDTSS